MDKTTNPMRKTIIVETEFGPVIVKKMVLAEYADLIRSLRNLPKGFAELFNGVNTEEDLYRVLPDLIADSWSDLIGIISSACDKDAEFIKQLDPADAMDLISAILELNNYQRIVASIKKVMAAISSQPDQTAPENPVEKPQL